MTVTSQERHTRAAPCSVCGGHDGMPRGKEVRCNGYTSSDEKWCFCSRVAEGAHHEVESAGGVLYVHLLRDEPIDYSAHFTRSSADPKTESTSSNDSGVPRSTHGTIVATYDYYDATGELAYQVLRLEPKSFRQRRPNGGPDSWIWSMAGVPRVMYRRREVAASEGVVFLCEGEKDADAVTQLGLQATTSAGGAKGAKASFGDGVGLLGGRDVCIIAHRDPDGEAYGAAWAAELEGKAKSVKIVRVPDGNDAADYIQAGATAASFLKLWTDTAEPPGPVRWLTLADMAVPLPPVDWICEQLKLARGPVSCLAGYGFSGKTAIAQALLLCLATGKSLFGLFRCPQIPVGWLDYEQGWRMSARRLQRQARGMGIDLSAYPANALRYAEFPDVYLDDRGSGVDKIAKATDGMGLCLMDSAKAITPGIDENDSRMRIPFDALSRVTQKNGCAFVVIHHYGKAGESEKPLKERMRGSSALFDAMQTVWGLEAKDTDKFTRCELSKDRVTSERGLSFGVEFVDDELHGAVTLRHLDPEQMRGPNKAALYKAAVLETVKGNPGCPSIESIRLYMPEGYRHTADVRAAVRELERAKQLMTQNGAYRAV